MTVTNYIIFYAKNKTDGWQPNRIFTRRERDKRYASFIENYYEPFEGWRLIPLAQAFSAKFSETMRQTKQRLGDDYEAEIALFVLENADRVVQPVPPAYEGVGQETRDLIDLSKENPYRVYLQKRSGYSDIYLRNGKRWLFYSAKLKTIDGEIFAGEPLTNLWDDLLSNNLHNEGEVKFPKGKKPEALVKRFFELFTGPNELVLDSFLGSGTTAAVAQKMGRRYIGIEMGEQAVTHCVPRLRRVIDGEQGGISESVNWKGGGGFRFYRLGEPAFDAEGRIRDGIRFSILGAHIWFSETGMPWNGKGKSPLLGIAGERAFALLYNGILGDKTPKGGNVLTRETLAIIREKIEKKHPNFGGSLTIYGEASRLSDATLARKGITFKQTPYEVKARK